MSHYTTELRYLCEKTCGMHTSPPSYLQADFVIQQSAERIFGQYPIFDEAHRKVLNSKIIRHYYFQEIGFETEGRFLFELNRKMNEIMPYYNKLYQSELLDLDIFENVNYKEIYDGNGDYRKTGEFNRDYSSTMDNTHQDTTTYGKKTVTSDDERGNVDTEGGGTDDNTSSKNGTSTITYGKNTKTDDINKNTHSDEDRNSFDESGESGEHSQNKYLATPETTLSGITGNEYLTDVRIIDTDSDYSKHGSGTKNNSGQATDDRDITVAESGNDKTVYSESGESHSNLYTYDNTTSTSHRDGSTQNSGNDQVSGTKQDRTVGQEDGGNQEIGDDKKHYEKTVYGNTGQAPLDVLQKLRDSFLNIDMMIIRELEILFMQIF